MAILDILHYPDARLRTKAQPVESVDDEIHKLVEDMFETMYKAPGIGLAATQVNVHKQVVVIDISEDHDQPLVLINAEIIKKDGEETMNEGCLSVPEVSEPVTRAAEITVRMLDLKGKPHEFEADGLLAVCIQHELDHLNGKLFVDYLSRLKLNRIRKKIEKRAKEYVM